MFHNNLQFYPTQLVPPFLRTLIFKKLLFYFLYHIRNNIRKYAIIFTADFFSINLPIQESWQYNYNATRKYRYDDKKKRDWKFDKPI